MISLRIGVIQLQDLLHNHPQGTMSDEKMSRSSRFPKSYLRQKPQDQDRAGALESNFLPT